MDFKTLSILFQRLEKTSKRLEKVMILRDFIMENGKDSFIVLDLICGNYQREINKKTIGISLKTVLSVIAFVSSSTEKEIEKRFNKLGDVGVLAQEFLSEKKQFSFSPKILSLEDITSSLNSISKKIGVNKNKSKKEILSKLFINAKEDLEHRFLARLLIDDLRIGVSEGVVREACVNAFFPYIIGHHKTCSKCGYVNLNLTKCFNCSTELDDKGSSEPNGNLKVVEVGTPSEYIGLDNFMKVRDDEENLRFMMRINRNNSVIKTENPREIYNLFMLVFERKYNVINSFSRLLLEISSDMQKVLDCRIILGYPIKSMLGVRANTIESAFEVTGKKSLLDFKYDGLRIQIHNEFGKVRLFSRNLDEITNQFPEILEFVSENFSDLCFVMDTECVGFDFKKNVYLPFQTLSRRIMTKEYSSVSQISVVVKAFDLMHIDSETLLQKSYEERRKILNSLFLKRKIKQKVKFDMEKIKEISID